MECKSDGEKSLANICAIQLSWLEIFTGLKFNFDGSILNRLSEIERGGRKINARGNWSAMNIQGNRRIPQRLA